MEGKEKRRKGEVMLSRGERKRRVLLSLRQPKSEQSRVQAWGGQDMVTQDAEGSEGRVKRYGRNPALQRCLGAGPHMEPGTLDGACTWPSAVRRLPWSLLRAFGPRRDVWRLRPRPWVALSLYF